MVNTSDINDKILRELKNTCDGEHEGLKVGLTTRKFQRQPRQIKGRRILGFNKEIL